MHRGSDISPRYIILRKNNDTAEGHALLGGSDKRSKYSILRDEHWSRSETGDVGGRPRDRVSIKLWLLSESAHAGASRKEEVHLGVKKSMQVTLPRNSSRISTSRNSSSSSSRSAKHNVGYMPPKSGSTLRAKGS